MTVYAVRFLLLDRHGLQRGHLVVEIKSPDLGGAVARAMHVLEDTGLRFDQVDYLSVTERREAGA